MDAKCSLTKRGVRNYHRYEGAESTQIAYERGPSHDDSWLVMSMLRELEQVCAELAATVETTSDPTDSVSTTLKRERFDS
ncbi:hypothetical protein [Haloarcula brevis]|uniref:hypothetical protein n=1 Tax=Haloarcula brevis TaxID=3111453 RepID=UPI00300EEA76